MHSLQERLARLPAVKGVLRLYLARGGSSAQTKVQFSSEPPAPLNAHILDLIDEIGDVFDRTGGLRVADLIRQPPAEFVIWSRGTRRLIPLDGVERALDIRRVWKRADGVIGLSPVWERRIGECPRCALRALGNFAGSEVVTCSGCGGSMSRQEYKRITLIRANTKPSKEDRKGNN